MKQLVFLFILIFSFPLQGKSHVYPTREDALLLSGTNDRDMYSQDETRDIYQRKPIQVDPNGELWLRFEADRSMTLYTKERHDIVNYDYIDLETIWGGYYFFTFSENKKYGMFMYRDKKMWITIEPLYNDIRKRVGINENDKYNAYVRECRNNYQTERVYYIDGYPYMEGMPPVMPNTPDQQAEWRKTEKVYTPRTKRITKKGLEMGTVTLAYDYTEIEFQYVEKETNNEIFLYTGFTPFAYRIRLDGKEYHQVQVLGDLVERQRVKPGDRLSYRIRFQPLPANPGTFDIIEGINGGWDLLGVTLTPHATE